MVKADKVALNDPIQASRRAARTGGSQVFLKQGEVFTLEQLMEAVVIASANDACVAIAEHIGGSTASFVDLMNSRAHSLSMEHTRYVNVHGLDDTPRNNSNLTTARDLS